MPMRARDSEPPMKSCLLLGTLVYASQLATNTADAIIAFTGEPSTR